MDIDEDRQAQTIVVEPIEDPVPRVESIEPEPERDPEPEREPVPHE